MDKLPKILIQLGIVIVPLFFLPITRDAIVFNKHVLLIVFALLLIGAYGLRSISQKKLVFVTTPLDLGVLVFAIAQLISLLIASPNIVLALYQPSGAATIFALTVIFYFTRQFIITSEKSGEKELHSTFIKPLMISGAFLSFWYIITVTGIFDKLPVPDYLKVRTFTPSGSLFTLVSYLTICVILAAQDLIMKSGKKVTQKAGGFVLAGILIAGLVASMYMLMQPANRPRLLPQLAGWSIAAETLKEPKNALFGVSPGNYVNVFTREKPVGLNTDDYWVFRYNTSSNYFFNVLSEAGLLGLASLLFLVYKLIKFPRKSPALYAILIATLLMPVNLLLLFALYILLAELASHKHSVYSFPKINASASSMLAHAFDDPKQDNMLASRIIIGASVVIILIVGAAFYLVGRGYYAEMLITQAIQNTQTTNHDVTYDLMLRGLQMNPLHPDYRIIFARTNLGLANLIAGQENLTEQQRQTVTQLITQGVNNAKIAVQLYPSAVTWENLAGIYASLIGVAQGADSWTVASYNEAIRLDPSNPTLRVQLGGIYYALGIYDGASRQFEIAVQLKGDYANAWYNLANTQLKLGNPQLAKLSYEQTLRLLDPNSEDYKRTEEELNKIIESANAVPTPTPQNPSPSPKTDEQIASPSGDLNSVELNLEDKVNPQVTVGPEEAIVASQSGDLLLPQQ